MFFDFFLKGLLIGFLVSMPAGPVAVMVIQRTANRDFKSGFYSGLGVAFIDLVWAALASFSVSYIISFLQTYKNQIQIVGGVLLLALGVYVFFSHPINDWKKMKKSGSNSFQMFITGAGISLSNPMPILTYIAIFASTHIVFNISNALDPISFLSGFFIGAAGWWTILTTSISRVRHHFNLRILWWFNKISGSLIVLFVIASTAYVLIKGNPLL